MAKLKYLPTNRCSGLEALVVFVLNEESRQDDDAMTGRIIHLAIA